MQDIPIIPLLLIAAGLGLGVINKKFRDNKKYILIKNCVLIILAVSLTLYALLKDMQLIYLAIGFDLITVFEILFRKYMVVKKDKL